MTNTAGNDCLFCRIARGEHDAHIVFEDERSLAFLDHRPLFPGHTLLIPTGGAVASQTQKLSNYQ